MRNRLLLSLVCAAMTGAAAPPHSPAPVPNPLLVGAIRWDNWAGDGVHAKVVLDAASHDRVPFFALGPAADPQRLIGDSAEVVAAENIYARAAGVDYWLFNYYAPTGAFRRDPGGARRLDRVLDRYLAAGDRHGVRFALILQQTYPADDLDRLVALLAPKLADHDHLRLPDGSVPLFAQAMKQWEATLGDHPRTATFFTRLREALAKAIRRPVVLIAVGSDLSSLAAYVGPGKPFAAFTSYADAPPNDGRLRSARECEGLSRDFWRRAQATGLPFIPNATLGWDMTPLADHPDQLYGRSTTPGSCAPATADEWRRYIADARRVAASAGQGRFDGILLYAWNELSEGGWIVPTRVEGTRRLGIVARALGRRDRTPREIAFTYPDDGDAKTSEDEWPCPPGMVVADDRPVTPSPGMTAVHSGGWTRRICRRIT